MAVASRAPAPRASAASTVVFAACLLLGLCGVATAFKAGDSLVVNFQSSTTDGSVLKASLVGYSPTGTHRGSVNLKKTAAKGQSISEIGAVTLSPEGKYAFLPALYITTGTETEEIKLIVINTRKQTIVTVVDVPAPVGCIASLRVVAAPGSAAGTYALYTTPDCTSSDPAAENLVVATQLIYNIQHKTLQLGREVPYEGGFTYIIEAPPPAEATGSAPAPATIYEQPVPLLEITELFTIGASTKLYALAEDTSTVKPALEFLRLSTSTGLITKLFTLKQPVNSTCYSTAISSATKIYSVCQSFTGLKLKSAKIFQFAKGKARKAIAFPLKGQIAAVATVPSSPYLTVVTTPAGEASGDKITITTLRVSTGKVVHSFSKSLAIFPSESTFAIVP